MTKFWKIAISIFQVQLSKLETDHANIRYQIEFVTLIQLKIPIWPLNMGWFKSSISVNVGWGVQRPTCFYLTSFEGTQPNLVWSYTIISVASLRSRSTKALHFFCMTKGCSSPWCHCLFIHLNIELFSFQLKCLRLFFLLFRQ